MFVTTSLSSLTVNDQHREQIPKYPTVGINQIHENKTITIMNIHWSDLFSLKSGMRILISFVIFGRPLKIRTLASFLDKPVETRARAPEANAIATRFLWKAAYIMTQFIE